MLFDPCQTYDGASAEVSPVSAKDLDGLPPLGKSVDHAPLALSQDHATVGLAHSNRQKLCVFHGYIWLTELTRTTVEAFGRFDGQIG
jgi:hypothetical protein